jgi:hypothetical protein
MQENAQPSTANIAAACAILAGVTGYMLGQAKSLGLFGGSAVAAPLERKENAAEESDSSSDEDDDEDEEEEDDSVPAEYNDHKEECKMVLVVRTDLGMTKGTSRLPPSITHLTLDRQNRRTVRSRDTGLLQALPQDGPELDDTAPLGANGPGKGGAAGQERGRDGAAAGAGAQLGTGGAHYTRCGAHANCEWECDGAGDWAGAEGCDRSGHWAFEAAVDAEERATGSAHNNAVSAVLVNTSQT